MQTATEVAASCCLLDLPVAEAVGSAPSRHSDLLLASACDATALSGQLFHCTDSVTQNGNDESPDSSHIPVERLSISDSGALLTLNGAEQSVSSACVNHLSTDNDADILSKIDDALGSYTDTSSEPV